MQDAAGGYGDPNIDGNLSFMKVNTVRHIGGTYGMFFNWLTGYPLKKSESINGYTIPRTYEDANNNVANTLTLFKNSIASEGAEMIFDLNLITSKFNHQRAGIMNALALGQRIKAVEFGNEFFNDGLRGRREFAYAFPTPEAYADSVNGWSKTLRETFGDTPLPPRTIAVGSDFNKDNDNNVGEEDRIFTWLPRVLNRVDWTLPSSPKGITIHRYNGAGYYDSNGNVKLELDNNLADMAKFLNTPFKSFAKFNAPGAELSLINAKGIKAYLTEYGMFDGTREVHGTWGHGLFIALQTLTFLESNTIELVDLHSMLGTGLFSCIFSNTTGLNLPGSFNDSWNEGLDGMGNPIKDPGETVLGEINPLDPIAYATIAGQRTAVGNALSLVGKALDEATTKSKLSFPGVLQQSVIYPNETATLYDKLYGWQLKGVTGDFRWIIVNNTSENLTVTTPAGIAGSYTMMAANPREYIVGNAVTLSSIPAFTINDFSTAHKPYQQVGTMAASAPFTFKPYSITFVQGAFPSTVVLETLGDGLCTADMLTIKWTDGKDLPLLVPNGKGPYTYTSNVAINAAGGLLNVTTNDDYLITQAYRPATLPATSDYNITYTVKDMGKGGATGSLDIIVKSQKVIDILNGDTPTSPSAGTTINACAAGCVTLTASNIDASTTNNRYQWYTVDGNKSFDSPGITTYGDNGYSQTVTICPQQADQKYYVIGYTGKLDCDFAIDEIIIKTPVASANPEINDKSNLYVCNTSPGNAINLGNPTPLGAAYTYLWTPTGSTTGTTISSTTIAQPLLTITSPSVTAVTYNVKVSLNSSCFNTSTVTVNPKVCCTTATDATLKFPPYTNISTVTAALNAICNSCVSGDQTEVIDFDNIVNFNGPVVMDKNVIFKGCDNLQFAQDAALSIRNYATVIIDNSKLDACQASRKWKGIEVSTAQEEVFIANGSHVKNATYGVEGKNNALVHALGVPLQINQFLNNTRHLKFEGYGGNYAGVLNEPGTITKSGIAYNNFVNTQIGATTNDAISFYKCLGSVRIGGVNTNERNTFNGCQSCIQSGYSGLVAFNNDFSNFSTGVRAWNAINYGNYLVGGNTFSSNYAFDPSLVEFGNKGTAISITAYANITPDSIAVVNNTIDRCRQGIYVSKITAKNFQTDLNGPYGGEIKNNTITLYKPNTTDLANGDYTHKGMVLTDNSGIDVVKNDIKTDPTTFGSLSPQSKIDKYFGTEGKNQGGGCDYFDNQFTQLGQMIVLSGNNELAQLKCNKFIRGTTVNYPGDGLTLGITAIQLKDAVAMSTQGTALNTANNTWQNFGPTYFRARWSNRGSTPLVPYKFNLPFTSHDPSSIDVFNATGSSPLIVCDNFLGVVINQNDGNNHQNNDLSKDGGDELDSLTIVNYEPTYDSTAVINDLYGDVTELQLTLDAIAAGLVDSATVIEIYAESAALGIYNLEQAISNGDSAAIIASFTFLPKDIVGDNYKTIAFVNAKSTEWTNLDSLDLYYVAYQRVDEGGPAIVSARNMLGIYVDESTIAPKSNQRSKNLSSGIILNIVPNPNNGSFNVNTNLPLGSKILIHNSLGQLVSISNIIGENTKIEIENIYNGIYSLSVIDLSGKSRSTSFAISK